MFKIASVVFLSTALSVVAQEKPRVYVSDSQSWEMGGGFGGSGHEITGSVRGGARPQTVEIMKTFRERCPGVVVTSNKAKADYVVLLDHEGAKGLRRDNKIAVFEKDGDLLYAGSTRSLGNAVKDGCAVMRAPAQSAAR
jgi:hypothetical protein